MNRLFFVISSLFLCAGGFILLAPSLVSPDLVHPRRIDSLFIQFERIQLIREQNPDILAIDSSLLFNPSDLGLPYQDFNVTTSDSLLLRGWLIMSPDSGANTILVLHDWNGGKIQKLNFSRQMYDRGYNICLMDIRAHGSSDGDLFAPGILAANDLKRILDSVLTRPGINHVAVYASGISTAIALQGAVYDGRADVLVLECPFKNFETLVRQYARRKWGKARYVFYPVLQRKLENIMQMPLSHLDLPAISRQLNTPMLVIASGNDDFYPPLDAYCVFDSSASEKKDLILVNKSTRDDIELVGGEGYYNAIAEFINSAIPKKPKKTKYKRLT